MSWCQFHAHRGHVDVVADNMHSFSVILHKYMSHWAILSNIRAALHTALLRTGMRLYNVVESYMLSLDVHVFHSLYGVWDCLRHETASNRIRTTTCAQYIVGSPENFQNPVSHEKVLHIIFREAHEAIKSHTFITCPQQFTWKSIIAPRNPIRGTRYAVITTLTADLGCGWGEIKAYTRKPGQSAH